MVRHFCCFAGAILAVTASTAAHEIHHDSSAATNPYTPFSFLIGDWDVSQAPGAKPFVRLKYHWAANQAYIRCGAYIGEAPHFEGMMMWNGVHRNLDVLLATDMERGLAQESGTATLKNGEFIQETLATYSPGVSAGGVVAGPVGSTNRMRETLRPLDAKHIAVRFEVQTSAGWKPMMPGADHLLMTRTTE